VAAIQGAWTLIGVEAQGMKRTVKETYLFTADKIKLGDDTQLTYRLGAAGNPQPIDLWLPPESFKPTPGAPKDMPPLEGICDLKGNILRICYPCPFATGPEDQMPPRPTQFTSTTRERYIIMHFQRKSTAE
jgi:uncharacterized protein (TIGR03067 family)